MNCCDRGKRFSSQRFDFLAQRDGGSYDPGLEYSSVFSRRSWWRTATRALKFIVEGEKVRKSRLFFYKKKSFDVNIFFMLQLIRALIAVLFLGW
jgi:hypothetical protein